MNPGAIEEGGETARSLITTLHDSPLTLALVVFNVIFILIVGYLSLQERQSRERILTRMDEQYKRTSEMLYNCTPNPNPRFPQEPH